MCMGGPSAPTPPPPPPPPTRIAEVRGGQKFVAKKKTGKKRSLRTVKPGAGLAGVAEKAKRAATLGA